jgi:protein arginine kinase
MKENYMSWNFKFVRIRDLTPRERLSYIEEHLISPDLVQKIDKSSFLLRDDEKVTIMINEEDHLRIQTLLPGLNLTDCWELCSNIDDCLESELEFAFREDLGYLTACPTNVGTGLRASVMLHLPCLTMAGNINSLVEALRKVGLTIRGIYGEGSEAIGNLYQISNQTTLGETEEEIIDKLNKIITQVVTRERNTRKYLLENKGLELEDRLFRSYGILSNCRLINSKEAMNHLSNVKLAYDAHLLNDEKFDKIIELMIKIRPATIQKDCNKDMDQEERDKIRANIIRDYFLDMEG